MKKTSSANGTEHVPPDAVWPEPEATHRLDPHRLALLVHMLQTSMRDLEDPTMEVLL